MRELEFLPAWYPQTRKRKRMVILQAWLTIVLAAGLGLFMFLVKRNVHAAEVELSSIGQQMNQTESELKKLDQLLALEKQSTDQVRVIEKLGGYVETTRMIAALESVMPKEMALLGLTLEIEEIARPMKLSRELLAKKEKVDPEFDRQLRCKMQGVAPTDVDLANFLAGLSGVPYFENVAMTYARDRSSSGHMMREFEVTFLLNLNTATVN